MDIQIELMVTDWRDVAPSDTKRRRAILASIVEAAKKAMEDAAGDEVVIRIWDEQRLTTSA